MLKQFMENVEKAFRVDSKGGQLSKIEYEIDKITGQIKELIRRQIKENVEPLDFQAEYERLQAHLAVLREQKNNLGCDGIR